LESGCARPRRSGLAFGRDQPATQERGCSACAGLGRAWRGGLTVTRRVVEYRLQLAGFDRREFQVTGAERTTVALTRRAVTADEVVTAARAELLRRLAVPPESVAVELVRPVAVKLPEVPAGEPVTITVQPRGPLAAAGRAQMDAAISAGGEKVLSLAVLF